MQSSSTFSSVSSCTLFVEPSCTVLCPITWTSLNKNLTVKMWLKKISYAAPFTLKPCMLSRAFSKELSVFSCCFWSKACIFMSKDGKIQKPKNISQSSSTKCQITEWLFPNLQNYLFQCSFFHSHLPKRKYFSSLDNILSTNINQKIRI